MWRGGLGAAYLLPALSFAGASIALPCSVSTLKDARMRSISAQQRPHYSPVERMAILQLRAACGWSRKQTADTFLVTSATIASWNRRVDEQGPDALLQLPGPVNRFPDFVRYAIQQLKVLCPSMGKVKIALAGGNSRSN